MGSAEGLDDKAEMNRYDELSRELAGDPDKGPMVAAVLARQLAASRHSRPAKTRLEIAPELMTLMREMREEVLNERLPKDRKLAILPSGNAVSVDGILEARFSPESGCLFITHADGQEPVRIDDRFDVAALRAALHNVGVAINAPTIAGEDRDGDGQAGE
jgi:hypothetical protein